MDNAISKMKKDKNTITAKFWGSRFSKKTDKLADKFSFSISYDSRLGVYDCLVGIAHAKMLGQCKIIGKKDSQAIVSGLRHILQQIKKGEFVFDPTAEDVHTSIQSALKQLIGPAADRLHTARSRNDLIVSDMKLYCRDEVSCIVEAVKKLQVSIVRFAEKNQDVIIPAYTHLQSAQVVLLSHHMLAYVEMFQRDRERLLDAFKRMDTMPLGSCALSGTSLPIDRGSVAKQLGFGSPTPNSIDSVSDRDFIIELISALAIMHMHFSRIAEDLILWATSEFNFIDIDFSMCTGSSIMPHKKNPDILELIRGETAGAYSRLNEILVLMKGLPFTYNRDMQLDKPPLFLSIDKAKDILELFARLFSGLKVKEEILSNCTNNESFFSVDIMEYLIKKGVAYRQAHDIVGSMIRECLDKGRKISSLTKEELKRFSPEFDEDVKQLLNPQTSVKIKASFGSTNPGMVKKQIEAWKKRLK